MSNIYIQEPSTSGKVLLNTTVGDIDVELWTRECPKACRNFIQLCLEGYYNGTIFHRVVPNFIVQGGDPGGTGTGGESIYGAPFKDELHSRLRFVRRGLVAMANSSTPNDNGSQFFFTLAPAPELNNKHTIFAKVVGDTLFNMLKMGELEVDQNERPLNPPKIISTEVLENPFKDIVPREIVKKVAKPDKPKKAKAKATKNFNLLSFGDEAEEDEAELDQVTKVTVGKSAHDVLKEDAKLCAQVAVNPDELSSTSKTLHGTQGGVDSDDEEEKERVHARIRDKLRARLPTADKQEPPPNEEKEADEEEDLHEMVSTAAEQRERDRIKFFKEETKRLQKDLLKARRKKEDEDPVEKEEESVSEARQGYRSERIKYLENTKNFPVDKKDREDQTLALLEQFKERMLSARKGTETTTGLITSKPTAPIEPGSKDDLHPKADEAQIQPERTLTPATADDATIAPPGETPESVEDRFDVEDIKIDEWLGHQFHPDESEGPKLPVLDANTRTDEDYDLSDPRNAMNKRRRMAGDEEAPVKKKTREKKV